MLNVIKDEFYYKEISATNFLNFISSNYYIQLAMSNTPYSIIKILGELTNIIRDYENFIKILAEQKGNINKTVKELTDLGWSGAAKDKFEQNHSKKQESYRKVEEDFKYVENAMEREEKTEAVKLKKRCEGFEDCIKRSTGGVDNFLAQHFDNSF